jgi:hypothetical protein
MCTCVSVAGVLRAPALAACALRLVRLRWHAHGEQQRLQQARVLRGVSGGRPRVPTHSPEASNRTSTFTLSPPTGGGGTRAGCMKRCDAPKSRA